MTKEVIKPRLVGDHGDEEGHDATSNASDKPPDQVAFQAPSAAFGVGGGVRAVNRSSVFMRGSSVAEAV